MARNLAKRRMGGMVVGAALGLAAAAAWAQQGPAAGPPSGALAAGAVPTPVAGAAPWAPERLYWPADSGYKDVKAYGAVGDGAADDTAAIKKAIADKTGGGAIYFPPGTYLVSDTLMLTPKRHFIQGAGPGASIIRLQDRAPGFADARQPRAVLQNWDSPIGQGANGQAFRNSVHDISIEVGAGNPGAIGLMYFNNNQGTVQNVRIRSLDPAGAGRAGIALAQNWPGPALFRFITIEGFDDGIWSTINQYSFTIEHLALRNQRRAGITNSRQMLFIRGLVSRQAQAPALQIDSGSVVLVEAQLSGTGPAAVVANGRLFARDVRTEGYRTSISGKAGSARGPVVEELASSVVNLLSGGKGSLRLAVEEAPYAYVDDPAAWVSVAKFGAVPGGADATEGIQKAIDSGAKVVYLPRGNYKIGGTIHVRGDVRMIHCMESGIDSGAGDAPVWRVEDGSSPVVILQQYEGSYANKRPAVEQATTRTLVLRTIIPRGDYRGTVPGGKLFLDDVCMGGLRFNGVHVWARQLNPENMGTKVEVHGGSFWVLGLKTEKAGTAVLVDQGGAAEVLGGYIYYNRGNALADGSRPAAFINDNAALSVAGITGGSALEERRGGQSKTGGLANGMYVGGGR